MHVIVALSSIHVNNIFIFRNFNTHCLKKKLQNKAVQIAFMGDSRMRQFYKAFTNFAEFGAKPGN